MPQYKIPEADIDIPRNALLLDTNVLVAAFYEPDKYHESAQDFLESWSEPFVIPITVLVETWGYLVGARKKWHKGFDLLSWLAQAQPGSALVVPAEVTYLEQIHALITSVHIDWVDAMLASFGNRITHLCAFNPPIRIATYDPKDFILAQRYDRLQYRLFDLRSLEDLEF